MATILMSPVVIVDPVMAGVQGLALTLQFAAALQTPGWLLEKVFLALFGVVHPLMMSVTFLLVIASGELKELIKLLLLLAFVTSRTGRLKLVGRSTIFPL